MGSISSISSMVYEDSSMGYIITKRVSSSQGIGNGFEAIVMSLMGLVSVDKVSVNCCEYIDIVCETTGIGCEASKTELRG